MPLSLSFPRFIAAVLLAFAPVLAGAADYNSEVLAQIQAMPRGGQYGVTRIASLRLQAAAHLESGKFCVIPDSASPSFCSGATYLVFLKTIESLRRRDKLELDSSALEALLIRGQSDGAGIWGRWNANGPGTARLFYELGLGRNFDDLNQARPGDFMKILWTGEIGRFEHGHSVIYLGREIRDGVEHVRFWSSNQPAGYGEKSVPLSKIGLAIFSRLEHPEALSRWAALPARDPYLASLTAARSSLAETRKKTGL
ncbi:MAG: hypothetical protein WCP06_04735 [Verrucomicrobiota bacterium]